jgi:uncharacterized protein (TIGR02996 family)
MSDSRQVLFQAVVDRPDDDAPRVRFAEFLDAQGDPYGAFIRAQLARTHALRHRSDEEAHRFGEEARTIENEHRTPAWTNGVEKLVRLPRFIRGFVEKIVVDAQQYLDRADEIYRVAPIRHLVLSEVGDLANAIARDPHLEQVVSLALGNSSGKRPIEDAGIAAIAASPHLRKLKSLEVSHQGITRAGLEALCASKTLPSLIHANVAGNKFEDPVEDVAADWATGRLVAESARLPPLGKELEAKYGELAWLHGPFQLRHYPLNDEEL